MIFLSSLLPAFMNSPRRTCRHSSVLLAIAIIFLFVGMEAPLLGMMPLKGNVLETHSKTPDSKYYNSADITVQNRRVIEDSNLSEDSNSDDQESEFGPLNNSTLTDTLA